MDLVQLTKWSELTAGLATVFGIFLALAVYLFEKSKSRKEHALQRFEQLNDQYRQWLLIFVERPELHDLMPYAPRAAKWLPEERRRATLFEIKLCELEPAYFLYQRQKGHLDRAQWHGWEEYIKDWMQYGDFRKAWDAGLADEFDQEFKSYVESRLGCGPTQQGAGAQRSSSVFGVGTGGDAVPEKFDPLKPYTEACNTLRHYSNASLQVRIASVVQGIVLLGVWALALGQKSEVAVIWLPLVGLLFTALLYRFHMGYFEATEFFYEAVADIEEKVFREAEEGYLRPFANYNKKHKELFGSFAGRFLTLNAPFTLVGTVFGLAAVISLVRLLVSG